SETRNTVVADSGRSNAVAQSVEGAAPIHDATALREAVAPTGTPKAIVEKPKPAPLAATRSSAAENRPAPAASASIVGPAVPDTLDRERNTGSSAVAAPASTANQTVTINGCLEMTVDQDQFRLTDTGGAGAPKARSWKSGFLKKGSA